MDDKLDGLQTFRQNSYFQIRLNIFKFSFVKPKC